jgi:NADH-quinone oxidoreductase subunit M
MGLLSLIVLAPLVAAASLLMVPDRSRGTVRMIALAGALVSLAGSLLAAGAYDLGTGGVQLREQLDVLPSLGIAWKLGADGWGIALLLLTAIINFAGVFATWTMEERSKEFYALLQLLVTGVFGVFVSLDLFIFFLFYEIAVLPMYLLIGIWGTSKEVPRAGPLAFVWDRLDIGGREYAAMKLTLMLLMGSALILAGFLGMVGEAGGRSWDLEVLQSFEFSRGLQMWAFPALWVGFGSLAGLFPFHTWSPDGHASAPTAVSMLHAGVLMKLGAFGVIRVGMVCLPEGTHEWAAIVGTVAVINVVWGALSAAGQTDLKYVIAYSSVSHMGIVMLGAATLTASGWNGAVFQMVAHGVMTGLFFALVGLIYGRAHSREIFKMGGFAARMPAAAVFFTIAGLSSLGMPGMAGFAAELLVFVGAWESAHSWWAVPAIAGAFITALYVLRAVRAIFLGAGPSEEDYPDLSDAAGTEWVALLTLGGCIILFGVAPDLILRFIDRSTTEWLPIALGGR